MRKIVALVHACRAGWVRRLAASSHGRALALLISLAPVVLLGSSAEARVPAGNPAFGATTREEQPTAPVTAAYDGTFLWVVSPTKHMLRQTNPNGKVIAVVPLHFEPGRVLFAGGYVWVSSASSPSIFRLNRLTNDVTEVVLSDMPGPMAALNGSLWIAGSGSNEVVQVNARSGTVVARVSLRSRAMAITSGKNCVLVAFGDGTSAAINPSTLESRALSATMIA